MDYKNRLARNIWLWYFIDWFAYWEFIIPIWVAFYTRIISFTQLALFNAVQMGIILLMELPTGALADLIGRKKTIILGYLLSAAGLLYVAFATTPIMILWSYVIRGIGEACVSGADTALFYDTLKELGRVEDLPKLAARYGFIIRMALGLGTFFGGYLFGIWVGLPYALSAVTLLLAALIMLFMVEPHIDSEKFTLGNYLRQTKQGVKQLLQNAHTKKLAFYYVLVGGITWACLFYFNQPFVKDAGFLEIETSWLFAAIYFLISLLIIYITHQKTLINRERVIIGLPILLLVGLLPGVVASKWLAALMVLVVTFAGSARFTFLDKYTNAEFVSKYRATAVSALNMLVNLFTLVLIGASGVVQDLFNTKTIFTFLGLMTLLVIVPSSFTLLKEHRKINQITV